MNENGDLQITTPTDREVMITRSFNAAPEMVFDAMTKPEMIRNWYKPKGMPLDVCEVDLRTGGKWRFTFEFPGGKKIGQYGVYQEIVRGSRLVNTEAWEDWDAGETVVTSTFEDQNGKTAFTSTILFPTREIRDTVLKAGFDSGIGKLYDRLEEALITK